MDDCVLADCGKAFVHPSRASGRMEWSLNLLRRSIPAELVEVHELSFSAACEASMCPWALQTTWGRP